MKQRIKEKTSNPQLSKNEFIDPKTIKDSPEKVRQDSGNRAAVNKSSDKLPAKKETKASTGSGQKSEANATGISGRNLYFQQLRSEITMSEGTKYKSLPDY
jgi:hypothetical protein